MGSTHSKKESEDTTSQAANGICCMVPRPPRLATILRMLRRHLSPAQNKQKLKHKQRSMAKRRALLRPMPRCSSFGSCGTLLTPTKRRTTPSSGSGSGSGSGAISTADLHYAQWKCMFEQEQEQQKESKHNTSEALSGQTTPRGFPSHTDPSRCLVPEEPLPSLQSPLYDYVGDLKVRRRLSLRSPLRGPSTSRQRSQAQAQAQARARLEAQLERELRDLEEYYGGFHFSQRSERFVRI
ncbi:protein nullo [Drosophila guanche]|uniref:Blast:Protein nullo n=1 Tax=Drosophila guanche TaxID=7266 RepID=A0A3B0JXH2_DROGU|nr:protein nullo [Drosophila guanche]SPP86765.1 blast:Protein nullo [Drosophila guanche]